MRGDTQQTFYYSFQLYLYERQHQTLANQDRARRRNLFHCRHFGQPDEISGTVIKPMGWSNRRRCDIGAHRLEARQTQRLDRHRGEATRQTG